MKRSSESDHKFFVLKSGLSHPPPQMGHFSIKRQQNNGKAKVSLHSLKRLDEFLTNPHLEQVGERSQGHQSIRCTNTIAQGVKPF